MDRNPLSWAGTAPARPGSTANGSATPVGGDSTLLHVDLGRVIHAMNRALDYVGVSDESHGRRVGLLSHRIAHALGWSRDRRHFVLLAGMLHDCGVSSTHVHERLIHDPDYDDVDHHCLRGAGFLQHFAPLGHFAEAVRYHHTHWQDFDVTAIDHETREHANLIFLADRLDVAFAVVRAASDEFSVLVKRDEIFAQLDTLGPGAFAPEIREAAHQAMQRDSFWMELQEEHLDGAIDDTLVFDDLSQPLGVGQLEDLGELISQIVDAKSPFTHYHSLRTAELTFTLARSLGLDDRTQYLLRIAGMLHDVGKLRIPDGILEKDGPLTEQEFARMKCHPLDSRRILKDIFPTSPICDWAAHHHEKLNGKGYPFGWDGSRLDVPTRVLAIADIFQALSQDRPYRPPMELKQVVGIMDRMVADGEIDGDIYQYLRSNAAEYLRISGRTTNQLERDIELQLPPRP